MLRREFLKFAACLPLFPSPLLSEKVPVHIIRSTSQEIQNIRRSLNISRKTTRGENRKLLKELRERCIKEMSMKPDSSCLVFYAYRSSEEEIIMASYCLTINGNADWLKRFSSFTEYWEV